MDIHYIMLADKRRLQAYQQAINAVVKPGDIVLDIGTGTGILALMAAQAGACKVYGIEYDSMSEVAKEIVAANDYKDVIEIISGDLRNIELPCKVDVLIGEMLGSFGIEENILALYDHACKRFLKPDGIVIPQRFSLWAAPFSSQRIRKELKFWEKVNGFNYLPIQKRIQHLTKIDSIKQSALICKPEMLGEFDLKDFSGMDINGCVGFTCDKSAVIDGFCGWFEAVLSDGIILDNNPASPPTHWRQMIFPLLPSVRVKEGDTVNLRITSTHFGDEVHLNWFTEFNLSGRREQRKQAAFLGVDLPGKFTNWFTPPLDSKSKLTEYGQELLAALSSIEKGAEISRIKLVNDNDDENKQKERLAMKLLREGLIEIDK